MIKLFAKRQFTITEDSIEINYDDTKTTTGQCFIKLASDEQAKISAALFNGYKLDAKHTFSACTFPDFDKIMSIEAAEEQVDKTSFLEIKAHCLETIKSQYAFQKGKQVIVNSLQGQSKVLYTMEDKEHAPEYEPFQSDKPF